MLEWRRGSAVTRVRERRRGKEGGAPIRLGTRFRRYPETIGNL